MHYSRESEIHGLKKELTTSEVKRKDLQIAFKKSMLAHKNSEGLLVKEKNSMMELSEKLKAKKKC